MKHVVMVNVLKKIVALVKVVIITSIVPAASRAVVGHAKVVETASVNLVPAEAIAKEKKVVVEVLAQTVTVLSTLPLLDWQFAEVFLSFVLLLSSSSSVVVTGDDKNLWD